MDTTTNYHLSKPGIGETGWGDEVNTNFDVIDTQIKANNDAITAHRDSNSAHYAGQILTGAGGNVQDTLDTKATTAALLAHTGATSGAHADTSITSSALSGYTTVNAALSRLNTGKAELHHNHEATAITVDGADGDLGQALSRISTALDNHAKDTGITSTAISGCANVNAALAHVQDQIDDLQGYADLLEPDMTGVTVTTSIQATTTGIVVNTTVSPEIYLRRVNLLITRGGNIIFNGGASQSFTLTHDFSQGDVVTARATIYAGQSTKDGNTASLTWYRPGTQPGITFTFTAADTSHAITEAALQSLLGWSAANGQSAHKTVAVISLLHHETTPGNYTLVPVTGTVKAQSTNSVEHLDALTLTGLTKDHLYSAYLQVQQINTK